MTMFEKHLIAEKAIADLREACLELAHGLDGEEQASAYAQADKYESVLREFQDFLIRLQ